MPHCSTATRGPAGLSPFDGMSFCLTHMKADRLDVALFAAAVVIVVARPGYGAWDLSADRANSIRRVLEEEGVPAAKFFRPTPSRCFLTIRSLRPTAA